MKIEVAEPFSESSQSFNGSEKVCFLILRLYYETSLKSNNVF